MDCVAKKARLQLFLWRQDTRDSFERDTAPYERLCSYDHDHVR